MEEPTPPKREKKSVYDAGYTSIFFRNFLEGFARGLGVITAYIFLGGIIYYIAITYILPQVKNIFNTNLPLFTPTIQVNPSNVNVPQGETSVTQEQMNQALEFLKQPQQPTP